jgi:putative tricarboxylic transport membrane protein
MEFTSYVLQSFQMLLFWDLPFWIIAGLIIGIFLGALPGVSGVLAISLLLGPSYYLPALKAIIFLTAIYTGSVYGGGISAVLMNIPGTPAAICTGFDGYPMTQQGRHNEALGLGIMSSAVGLFGSYIIVLFLFLPLGRVVLKFGPAEMLLVVIFALTSVGMVRSQILPNVLVGLFGILLGTVGSSPYGNTRGILGQSALMEGLPLIPALLGMLAVSELLVMIEKPFVIPEGLRPKQNLGQIVKGMVLTFRYPKTLFRSSLVGLIVGLMPAAGSTIASIVSYGLAKRAARNPDDFGKGEPRGVIAAETANNASEGGAVATMMLLGIPGSVTTALLIAAFMIHGMSPGPFLVRENLDFAYAVILSQFPIAVILVLVAALFVNYFGRVIYLPTRILVPAILVFAVVGSLANRGLVIDIFVMLLFALLGFVLKKLDYPVMGFVLGFILGKLVDSELLKAILLFEEEVGGLFQRPAFLILLAVNVLSLAWPKLSELWGGKARAS